MTDYLVFNDLTGEFASSDAIIAVKDDDEGSLIFLLNRPDAIVSPLKPRELLRRLTIMRFKRENGTSPKTGHPSQSTL
jgi:hypothetical protein